eukprot:3602657-Pyramimonas_sp.AAC.1
MRAAEHYAAAVEVEEVAVAVEVEVAQVSPSAKRKNPKRRLTERPGVGGGKACGDNCSAVQEDRQIDRQTDRQENS